MIWRTAAICLVLLCPIVMVSGQSLQTEFKLSISQTGTESSFRGLSVVDNQVAWLSGSKGFVCRSLNGGNQWKCQQVKGFESSDFRSIYGFDSLHAVIANAGSPAHILKTHDGGLTWNLVFENRHADAFIDGIDFWNAQVGLAYGDPIDGKMLLIKTLDAGNSWFELPPDSRSKLESQEASFAASGTGIRCFGTQEVMISTGGFVSRLWQSKDQGAHWTFKTTPIIQGKNSTGIYSFDLIGAKHGIMVGGDYKQDTLKTDHVFYTHNGGKSWIRPNRPTRGYRECVVFAGQKKWFATGPTGTDFSSDDGKNWLPFSDETGFHVIRKARKGNLLLMAGSKGKVGLIHRISGK